MAGSLSYPIAEFGPCDRPVLGDVAAGHPVVGTVDRISMSGYRISASQCGLEGISYTGRYHRSLTDRNRPSIVWTPAVSFQNTAVGPSAVQRAVLHSGDPTHGGAFRFEILAFRETVTVVEPSDELRRDTYITCIATAQGVSG